MLTDTMTNKFDAMCERWELTEESRDYGLLFMAFKEAYQQGREDMHKLVMETWDAPYTTADKHVHISDRLKELK